MAFLSDDLPSSERTRVEGHLALCWPCNERYQALRETMRQIREAADEESVLDRSQIDRSRAEFLARYAALEAEHEFEQRPEHVRAVPSFSHNRETAFPARFAIAAALVCALGIFAWVASRPPAVQFDEVLSQTLKHDGSLRSPQAPVHQEFKIEIQQVKPELARSSGVLQVWYDSGGERFASLWERGGDLQYAVWRPDSDREFVYNAQLGATAVARPPQSGQTITLGELTFEEASLEQLESGFLYWLGNRRWEPISIASEVNVFRTRDDVVAEVESVTSSDGRPVYRITAHREMKWGSVELVAEVDAETYQSRIELLRLTSEDRVVELRLRAQRTLWLPSGTLESGLFWPSVDIEGGGEALAELRPAVPARSHETTQPDEERPARPTAADLDLAEMQVRHALHRAGACLGVPVRVDRSQEGEVLVEGLVDNAERKQELLAQLSEVSSAHFVHIDIKTVDEALQNSAAGESGAAAANGLSLRQADETFEVVATDSPIRGALERYLRRANGAAADDADLQRMASEFSDGVISDSMANLAEAWALRRLAERYGETSVALPESAQPLLREMLAAHVSALRLRTAGIRNQVRPLLLTVASDGWADGSDWDISGELGGDWASQSQRVFQQIEATESITTGLFADSGNAIGSRRDASSKQAAGALLRALPPLENRLRLLEEHVAALNLHGSEAAPARLPADDRP